ncbi:hypothetical protein HYO65_gp267 [Tenacibaculum phage PTm1]|uniref:Uncharacterized protein n=2 Tax=Shirahamavirus PTm1 TaxID=2846435 RepID=A0A5S9EQT4_9CAUD|nr:hypothetical protein HYO65_gp267 [Tenacibaculum phage PTm1]BBI90659.1 hypothetical protein [Tenacibaculum phage PTm1]BBI90964.1 hypothetical protein [Tenacibaculum phage PTm5]
MNKRPIISYDCDGIIANFYKAICDRYNKPMKKINDFYVPWIGKVYEEVANDPEFWREMPTMIQPNEMPYIDYYISTIRESNKLHREYWLNKNGYQNRPLYVSDDKHILINELGVNIHVDDKLETIINITNECPDCTPILHQPWYLKYKNVPEGIIVTNSTKELNSTIQAISRNYRK